MKVKGFSTTLQQVEVEVTKETLKQAVLSLLKEKYSVYSSLNYLSCKKGEYFLHEYEYTHPHNNDDIYKTRPATEEEIKVYSLAEEISSLFSMKG